LRVVLLAVLLLLLFASPTEACSGTSRGADHHSEASHHAGHEGGGALSRGGYGGEVFAGLDRRYEIVYLRDGIRVHGYDEVGKLLDLEGAGGEVRVALRGGDRTAQLAYVARADGGAGWLEASLSLRGARRGRTEVRIAMWDLPSEREPELTISGSLGGTARAAETRESGGGGHQH
jgi:hypothetical protein